MNQTVRSIAHYLCFLTIPCALSAATAHEPEPPVVSRVAIATPPPRQELITAAPNAQTVWVVGHWQRTLDDWNWIPGAWIHPPFANACWTPGKWQPQRGQYVWIDAQWIAGKYGLILDQPLILPWSFPENIGIPPASSKPQIFQPGHWEWQGTWTWEPGVFVEEVFPKAKWVFGQFNATRNNQYRWTPSHWEK